MFDRVLEFFVNHMPTPLEQGVNPRDPLNVIRPKAPHDDLGKKHMNAWPEYVMAAQAQAFKAPNAWTVNEEGELMYDVMFVDLLRAECSRRNMIISNREIHSMVINASGHSDYCSKIAAELWRKEDQQSTTTLGMQRGH